MSRASELPHGIHRNVLPSVYHARELGMVSKSALDLVHRSAAHYKAWIDGVAEEEESDALTFGSAFHTALLEPERFASEYVTEPDFGDCRRKENRAARDQWRAQFSHCTAITASELRAIIGMREAVQAHKIAGRMMRDGEAEVTLRWKDKETGLECKSRADYYVRSRRMVADVKTTQDARASAFKRSIATYRYFVQDALYREAFAAVGEPIQHFVFVAVEKTPPYAVATFSMNIDGIALGHTQARRDIRKLADCMSAGEWPAYDVGIEMIDLPPWAA